MTVDGGFVKYVSLAFALVYLLLGVTFLVKSHDISKILNGFQHSIPLGILFIFYGLFRGYRAYQRYF